MIPANELRKRMKNVVASVMRAVESSVESAANEGKYTTSVALRDGFDYTTIVEELDSLGYAAKVKTHAGDWRDQGYRTLEVSWRD